MTGLFTYIDPIKINHSCMANVPYIHGTVLGNTDKSFKLGSGDHSKETKPRNELSNEKNLRCLGYIGDYITELSADYFINHYKDPYETTSISWKVRCLFFRGSVVFGEV